MKKTAIYSLAAILMMLAFMPRLAAEEKKNEITVSGMLEVQDEEDENSALLITDFDADKTYVIVMDKQGKDLKKLVGKMVKVTGVVGKQTEEQISLTVKKFEEVKEIEVEDDWGADE